MKKYKTILLSLILVLTGILVSGCVASSGNYGKLRYDDSVKKTFEDFEVYPQYKYYYFGTRTFPEAFMGLNKDVELKSDHWRPIELTPEILHNWIWLHAKRTYGNVGRYGSVVLDTKGNQLGVYYSLGSWRQWTTVRVVGDNQIKVASPKENNDRKFRRRNGGIRL